MKYKAAIFDMDGTILNTLDDIAGSLNHALAACGFPQRTLAEVRCFVGNGIRRLVELGVPSSATEEETQAVFHRFRHHYALHCAERTQPYGGVVEAITLLRSAAVKTAVVSNKADDAVTALCKRYFPDLFDFSLGAREDMRKKPWPDPVIAALEALGVSAGEAVYIGDSEVDVQTAQNARMNCILVDWGFRGRESLIAAGADVIVSDADALVRAVKGE